MNDKKINVTTDTIGHKGETRVEKGAQPCKKVKLGEHMSPAQIREMLEKKRAEKQTD